MSPLLASWFGWLVPWHIHRLYLHTVKGSNIKKRAGGSNLPQVRQRPSPNLSRSGIGRALDRVQQLVVDLEPN
jgi:hypothetical protein